MNLLWAKGKQLNSQPFPDKFTQTHSAQFNLKIRSVEGINTSHTIDTDPGQVCGFTATRKNRLLCGQGGAAASPLLSYPDLFFELYSLCLDL